MQTNNNETKNIHIKAVLNNEFRRFSMNKASFSQLEETIRTVYSLDPTEKLKICFVDDEKDNVAMSSDEEFLYAVDLVRPVRLIITLATAPTAPAPVLDEAKSCNFEIPQAEHPCHSRRGGRGRFGHCRGDKQGWNEERKKERLENMSLTKEERIQQKTAKISEKIKQVEAMLLTDLPAHRERTLSWKLERLQAKLARLQSWASENETPSPTTTAIPTTETSEAPQGRRGCRGRGRGGCGRGRRAFENTEGAEGCGQMWGQIMENIRTCRQNLRAAYQSGNQEEIDRCTKALEEAKSQKWEAKQKAKASYQEGNSEKPRFFEEKSHKRECMKNLREAKVSGNPDRILACEQALIEAKEALQKAKVASKC